MLSADVLPNQDEVSLLFNFSLITETKDQADIQTSSSEDHNLKYFLFYNCFFYLNKEIK